MIKLKETVKRRGRSNRKVMMVDWDKTPFVFSVRSRERSEGQDKSPKLTRCKSILTIEEEEEGEFMVVTSQDNGKSF